MTNSEGSVTLRSVIRARPGWFLIVALCSAAIGALGWATAHFVRFILDQSGRPGIAWVVGGGVAAVALLRFLLTLARQALQLSLSGRIEIDLSHRFWNTLLSAEMKSVDGHKPGDLLRRLHGVDHLRWMIGDVGLGVVFDAVLVGMALVLLLPYGPAFVLIVSAGAAVPAAGALWTRKGVLGRYREVQEHEGRLSQIGMETLRGLRDLRLQGAEEEMLARLDRSQQGVQRLRSGLSLRGTAMQAWSSLVTALAGVALLLVGAGSVRRGSMTPGDLMFVFTMAGMLFGPLEQLVRTWFLLGETRIALHRFNEILKLPAEPRVPDCGERHEGALRFEHVSYSYRSECRVLGDIDLEILPGSTVAIVGESGAGKSTLLALLAGLYRPDEGRILIDGTDLRKIPLDRWRSCVGAVLHEPRFFEGTVEENLRLGRPDASFEDVRRAARLACAEEFILERPEGYRSVLQGNGGSFSAGQFQRLALARAFVRNPRLLLLDEATNNLDGPTEASILLTLADHSAERTTVFVSHRLSSSIRADRIVVLQDGRMVESGTYEELMKRGGAYYRLWMRQMGPTRKDLGQTLGPQRGIAVGGVGIASKRSRES